MLGFINRVYQVNWPPQRDLSAAVLSVSPSSANQFALMKD